MIHLTVPHGLEQSGGAAWGTRDVCQGPVELLLALEHDATVREILRIVFAAAAARPRGDWPQWFMLEPYAQIRDRHSHGDVIVWPLKALCDYVEATGDLAFLDEPVAWRRDEDLAATERRDPVTVARRRSSSPPCARASSPARTSSATARATGTNSLAAGRPAPARLDGVELDGGAPLPAARAATPRSSPAPAAPARRPTLAALAAADARRLQPPPRPRRHRRRLRDLRPRAAGASPSSCSIRTTPGPGSRYSLLPMTRSIIGGLFTDEQARHHLELIRAHLLFPDGARLMDRPVAYRGGPERVFRRAESAAFFGREIGLMYVHAHLRYGEAMATLGEADGALGGAARW